MIEFGKIQSVPLRDIWPGEAVDFTPWLANNLGLLAETLGMDLELETTEASAGDFSADIVAKDISTNRIVVIENQYGSTDHRHLGQIITYSSVLGAGVVIWVAENIRQEHKAAIDFLNMNLKEGLQLYALEATVMRIDESKPAFNFNVICMPAEAPVSSSVGAGSGSETKEKYRGFFQELIDELRVKYKFTNARSGQPQSWYAFTSENSKVYKYSASFANGGRVRVEVYIDCGDKARNEALFDALYAQRSAIESSFGGELVWERLDNKRACRVAIYRDGEIDVDSETLNEIKLWTIENLMNMKRVFPRFIESSLAAIELFPGSQVPVVTVA